MTLYTMSRGLQSVARGVNYVNEKNQTKKKPRPRTNDVRKKYTRTMYAGDAYSHVYIYIHSKHHTRRK